MQFAGLSAVGWGEERTPTTKANQYVGVHKFTPTYGPTIHPSYGRTFDPPYGRQTSQVFYNVVLVFFSDCYRFFFRVAKDLEKNDKYLT